MFSTESILSIVLSVDAMQRHPWLPYFDTIIFCAFFLPSFLVL
jgi:hypothetical protein